MSKQLSLPPFVLFQDPSLEDMAIQYPIALEELQNIMGVGAGKAKRYGAEFIKIIKSYVEEKEIIRPQDMVVKSVVNKSNLKVFIIQSIDRQMDFEDIASAKNLDLSALLDEIEAIVNSGTKINVDYYINSVMDKDHQQDIYDYFMDDAENESVEAALKELGEENYSEEEIRLMRIKFISELGN
jgi:ATP-dependent DNA helicase RecQ